MKNDCETPALTLEEALLRILAAVKPLQAAENLNVRQALGRVLAENIYARIDLPPFTNAAMDGYAINGLDSTSFKQVGKSLTGAPYLKSLNAGECVYISTGAIVPEGTQAVVMQENVTAQGESIVPLHPSKRNENIRFQGEEIKIGEKLIAQGKRLNPADLGLLTANGLNEVQVIRKARIAFFSTGSELQSVGQSLEIGQIYDSNRTILHALLEKCGVETFDLGIVKDDKQALKQIIQQAAAKADAIISTGGASASEVDFIAELLNEIGQIDFWKIAIKPGKPVAFGRIDQTLFFGLPGNPVSGMITFEKLVRPALFKLMGSEAPQALRLQAVCQSRLKKSPGRVEFQRGFFSQEAEGFSVTSCAQQGSHILQSMSQANCFIVLPAENAGVNPGESIDIEPF